MQHEKLDDQEDPRGAWRLVDLDHAGWAWEWLRRNPRYRADVALIEPSAPRSHGVITLDRTAADRARLWGLHFRRGPGHPGKHGPAPVAWRPRSDGPYRAR